MPARVHSRFPEIAAKMPGRVGDALDDAADLIVQSAKQKVPVRTRALHNAIEARRESPTQVRVVAGDDDAWYGHLVEFGTAKHLIPNSFGWGVTLEHPGASPKPFLVPALEEQREPVEVAIRSVLGDL